MKSLGSYRKSMAGMTLVELIIAGAMAAIMMTIAIPSMKTWSAKRQINAEYREIKEAFRSARDLARSNEEFPFASICPSADGTACNGTGWKDGWIVFGDLNGNGTFEDANDRIFLVQDKLSSGSLIKIEDEDRNTRSGAVTYNSNGYTSALRRFNNADAESLIVTFCNSIALGSDGNADASYARGVILAPAGIVRNTIDYDGNGTHEFPENEELTCPAS